MTDFHKQAAAWVALGHAAKATEHAAREATKLGHFRAGTAGLQVGDVSYGKCPRVALLRSMGLEDSVDANTREMFEAGFANEDVCMDLLGRGLAKDAPDLEIVTGDGIRGEFRLKDGTPVTMSPDALVRVAETGTPVLGFEFKLTASMWSAIGVHYDLRPKSDHLIQAGLYSIRHGKIPFVLYYANRSEYHLSTAPKWLKSKFGPGTYDVEFKREDATEPLKIRPFNRFYLLTWDGDNLQYTTDGLDTQVRTVVTGAGIEAFYDRVAKIRDGGDLGPRPSDQAVDGSKSYLPCTYCDLKDVCDAHESNRDVWLDQARLQLGAK